MRLFAILLLAGASGCLPIQGFTVNKPETELTFDPVSKKFKYKDSKNNDVKITGLEVEGKGKVESVEIRNNASDVIDSDARRLKEFGEHIVKTNWEGFEKGVTATGNAFTSFAAEVLPHVPKIVAAKALGKLRQATTFTSPIGGGSIGGVPAGVAESLIDIAGIQDGAPFKAFDDEFDKANTIENPTERIDAIVRAAEKLRAR